MSDFIRVRFAPAPTGTMHLGNVRTALINFLFARQHQGTFIIRLEDTDMARLHDPNGTQLFEHLAWLGLQHNEGPDNPGLYGPYKQSERSEIYRAELDKLIAARKVYRCFCTPEQLEQVRARQIALKQPPRYEKSCLQISPEQIEKNIQSNIPYIWRLSIDPTQTITFTDLAKGTMQFDLKNFSDISLTRSDHSVTFLFANCVDDALMKISHVIRGEDHLTNTVGQVALYQALGFSVPLFWHLPIITGLNGKKLSKRDFGFSLEDLRTAGFLPEAICNYLGILGRTTAHEIQSLTELTQSFDFTHLHATSTIKYDLEKLRWINHQWILKLDPAELARRCEPFMHRAYPQHILSRKTLERACTHLKNSLITLADCKELFKPLCVIPAPPDSVRETAAYTLITKLTEEQPAILETPTEFLKTLKQKAAALSIPPSEIYHTLRLLLSGTEQGMGISDLILLLGGSECIRRITESHYT